jgi:5-methylcytosine-specific restriction endonuclease McrA
MIVRHGYAVRRNKDSYQRAKNRRNVLVNATTCGICGHPFKPGDIREADHITPVSAGGSDALSNLRATHRGCNRRRGQG